MAMPKFSSCLSSCLLVFGLGILAVWLILVMLSDNFLKPLLLGRGAPVPMPVIFLGSIGGFMTMGFLGLFVGAIVLSIGFKLFESWLNSGEETAPAARIKRNQVGS